MANTFKREELLLTASFATIYTCPALTTAIVIGMRMANIDGGNEVNCEVKIGQSGSTFYHTGVATPIPIGSALKGIEAEKIVLEAGDIIEAKAGAINDVDMSISIMEIT